MAYLVVLVLDDPGQCPDLLRVWDEAGISGVTMLESTGLGRLQRVLCDDLPLIPAMRDLLGTQELHHRTLHPLHPCSGRGDRGAGDCGNPRSDG